MGRFQRALVLTVPAVACQPAAAPPQPAEPSKSADAKPAAPVATSAPARPAEAAKPADAAKPVVAAPASRPAGTPWTGGTLRVALSGGHLISDDTPMVFIQHRPEVKVMLPTVQGFSHVPDGMMRLGRVSSMQ